MFELLNPEIGGSPILVSIAKKRNRHVPIYLVSRPSLLLSSLSCLLSLLCHLSCLSSILTAFMPGFMPLSALLHLFSCQSSLCLVSCASFLLYCPCSSSFLSSMPSYPCLSCISQPALLCIQSLVPDSCHLTASLPLSWSIYPLISLCYLVTAFLHPCFLVPSAFVPVIQPLHP